MTNGKEERECPHFCPHRGFLQERVSVEKEWICDEWMEISEMYINILTRMKNVSLCNDQCKAGWPAGFPSVAKTLTLQI